MLNEILSNWERDGEVSKDLIPKIIVLTIPWFYVHPSPRQIFGVSEQNPGSSLGYLLSPCSTISTVGI